MYVYMSAGDPTELHVLRTRPSAWGLSAGAQQHGLTSILTWFINYTNYKMWYEITYNAHKKFMNTSTTVESVASFILEGWYLENQTS